MKLILQVAGGVLLALVIFALAPMAWRAVQRTEIYVHVRYGCSSMDVFHANLAAISRRFNLKQSKEQQHSRPECQTEGE